MQTTCSQCGAVIKMKDISPEEIANADVVTVKCKECNTRQRVTFQQEENFQHLKKKQEETKEGNIIHTRTVSKSTELTLKRLEQRKKLQQFDKGMKYCIAFWVVLLILPFIIICSGTTSNTEVEKGLVQALFKYGMIGLLFTYPLTGLIGIWESNLDRNDLLATQIEEGKE